MKDVSRLQSRSQPITYTSTSFDVCQLAAATVDYFEIVLGSLLVIL